jgi:hypothetical protein
MKPLSKLFPVKEPVKVHKVGVKYVYDKAYTIYLHTDADTSKSLDKFGKIKLLDESDKEIDDEYRLVVDTRYDFDEVVNYLKSL